MLSTTGPIYRQWRDELALSGLVTVGVEFRNAGGRLGPHPFPAGLNDCFAALSWMHKNKSLLKVSGIVISGESGGGNLAIATCLKAKQANLLACVQGVYAQAPILSNAYIDKDPMIPSLFECDGYAGMDLALVAALTKLYDPEQIFTLNPLAWPLFANKELLQDYRLTIFRLTSSTRIAMRESLMFESCWTRVFRLQAEQLTERIT